MSNLALRIEAAIKLLYPEEITPAAKNVLQRIIDEESQDQ
jgi:hypothetical protein